MDNYDLALGYVKCIQQKKKAVIGIGLSTSGGQKHLILDTIKNATIGCSSIAFVFETNDSLITGLDSKFKVRLLDGKFNGAPIKFDTWKKVGTNLWQLELSLYKADSIKYFRLDQLKETFAVVAVGFGSIPNPKLMDQQIKKEVQFGNHSFYLDKFPVQNSLALPFSIRKQYLAFKHPIMK
jgi:hypothetical protein